MSNLKNIIIGKNKYCTSIWFMRQAGRYLPEFRKIRSQNQNFINLCLNSDLSAEITLQPISRYNLDSAIIFSDILLVPYALGQEVQFVKDKGPQLNEFNKKKFFNINKKIFINKLSPVYKAIQLTRQTLSKEKSLISFIGAPWTLLVYMFGLKRNKNELDLLKLKKKYKEINEILSELTEYLCTHIEQQVNAGADVVQIFDSWAGLIPEENLKELCLDPNLKIVEYCKKINTPVICFPKGIKENYKQFNDFVKPDALSLDSEINPLWAKANLKNVVLQGGMDPKILLKPEKEIYEEAKKYLDTFKDVPYIFNLGHGLIPETEPEKVKNLIKFVREFK